jgi:hypothetical protein
MRDPAAGLAQQRQERLGDGELPGEVGLQQPPELLEGDELQRAEHADAGVSTSPSSPALPVWAATVSAAAAIWAGSVTSSSRGVISPEPAEGGAGASAGRRTPAQTCHPAAASRSAVARPIPEEVPVIRTWERAPEFMAAPG